MTKVFEYSPGGSPLLISVPHDGRHIPADIAARMTSVGRAMPDTDWHVARLYEFAQALNASILVATHSRYVVDLNRAADDSSLYPGQVATGLCPEHSFAGEALYLDDGVTADEKEHRVASYWQPYHDQLANSLADIRGRFGYALLWDAHSIPSEVPRLFPGQLPVLNLGSNDGRSCAAEIAAAVQQELQNSPYSQVHNGRFKGGFITRHYGAPDRGTHALQMEISQRAYMDEATGEFDVSAASQLRATLRRLLHAYEEAAKR